MGKKIFITICFVFAIMFVSLTLNASNSYISTNDGFVRMDDTFTIPRVISCINNGEYTGTAEEIAEQYLTANSNLLFNTLSAEIQQIQTINNPSGTHIGFQQEVNKIPVIGSEIVVSLNNQNAITMVANGYKPSVSVSTNPSIQQTQAIQIARNSFANPNFTTIAPIKSQLSIYVDDNNSSYLVWKLNIVPSDGGDWYILVDALLGTMIKKEGVLT